MMHHREKAIRWAMAVVVVLTGGIVFFSMVRDLPVTTQATKSPVQSLPNVIVYKSPSCHCCEKWVTHLERQGFVVQTYERRNMHAVKAQLGLVPGLASCHTALVDGYVIEGHVPASDIKKLLVQKPRNISGLAAPGMPRFSPGMQEEGLPPRGYEVLAFDEQGQTAVFNHY